MINPCFCKIRIWLFSALLLGALPLGGETVEFRQAIAQALKHSGTMLTATAARDRATQLYRAERFAYMPTILFGSGLGTSFGQPISVAGDAPALMNVTHTQTLFNLAQRDTIRAAHSDVAAAGLELSDRSEQVILDTALTYLELDNTAQRLAAAQQQKQAADQAWNTAQQRQQEGMSSQLDVKRAELDAARVDLSLAQLETNVTVLREQLARAIGDSAQNLETVTSSIPPAPALPNLDDVAAAALSNSTAVLAADERLHGARLRARAEHHVNYPSINFAGQYAYLSTMYHYDEYYKKYSQNNYSFGLNIRIPITNFAQNARAAAADADALRAEAEAQAARERVSDDAVRAQRTVHQLEAAVRVSRLEYEVAQATIDATELQIKQGHATIRDQQIAQADVAAHQVTLLNSQFEFQRAQLQLLRQTGGLRSWALGEAAATKGN